MRKSVLPLCVALAGAALVKAPAQQPAPAPLASTPRKLTLEMIRIADSEPPQALRVLTSRGSVEYSTGFKSLGSPTLKELLKRYPKGTSISWYASCIQLGPQPSREEFAEFGAYCRSIGLHFNIVPSS